MRARITHIALRFDGRVFEIGDEVVAGRDIPTELLQARLDAGTAEPVLPQADQLAALEAAIVAYVADLAGQRPRLLALIEQAGGLGPLGARLMLTSMATAETMAFAQEMGERFDRLAVLAASEDTEQDLQSGGSPAQGGGEAGGDAASEADDLRARSSAETSSAASADASTHAPQPEAGPLGDAGASASADPANAGAPAPAEAPQPGAPSTPKKKSARKGAAKGG